MSRLMTAAQVAEAFGLPTPRTVRTMVSKGLPVVRLGRADLFDVADVEAFIATRKESRCPAPIPALVLNGSTSAKRSTSSGTNAAESAAVQHARQIAATLKRSSRNSSGKRTGDQVGRANRGTF